MEKDIGYPRKNSAVNPMLINSGLHPEVIKKIQLRDSGVLELGHRRDSTVKNTNVDNRPVSCWLSQFSQKPDDFTESTTAPGGKLMCNQCQERQRLDEPVNCFYFIQEDRIVVYE